MKKIIFGSLAAVLISRIVSAEITPQIITLADSTKLTFLGLTTGVQRMAPGFENLPTANRLYTPDCPTIAWIKVEHYNDHDHNWTGTLELLVSDKSRTACVSLEKSTSSNVRSGVDIQGFILRAFPRWDKEFIVRVRPYRGEISKGEFVVSNLAPIMAVTNWVAESLPVTKSDGNLEVTLTKLVAGAPTPSSRDGSLEPTNDPVNQCIHLNFVYRQNGQSTTNWQPWPVQTTDAAGNWSRGLIYPYPTNGVRRIWGRMISGAYIPPPEHYEMDGYFYKPGLWPDETWKVRLEFIQQSDFSDDEIVTFTNLPVKPGTQQDADDEWTWDAGNTNSTFIAQGNANGVHLRLLPPLLVPDQNSPGQQKYVSVIIEADPNFNPKGMNLTVVSATDDQGRDISSPFGSPWAGHYNLDFPNVREIKSLNLKLALHKSRFVEFTIKPTKQ